MNHRKKLSLRPPALQVENCDDPFEQYDKLDRKEPIERLTQLLENVESPFVLGIDSAWGSGKTTFLQLWDWHLRDKGLQTVFFNAWEHDYLDDPLLALLAEITRDTETGLEQNRERVLKTAGQLLRKSVPVAVRLLSQGFIDIKSDKGEEAIAEILETTARDKIQEFEDSKSSLDDFREALEDLIDKASNAKPLVFFIDELDRCRPTYAVELLERIKHFFEARGLVFVFGIHADQLANSVRAIYGTSFDGRGYLRRFFDLLWQLPMTKDGHYTKELIRRAGWATLGDREEISRLTDFLSQLSDLLELSLRDQERCVNFVNLVLHSIPSKDHIYPGPLSFLSTLRVWDTDMFSRILRGEDPAVAFQQMELVAGKGWRVNRDNAYNHDTAWLEALVLNAWKQSGTPPRSSERLQQLKRVNDNQAYQDPEFRWCKKVAELLGNDRFQLQEASLGWPATVDRIHFVGRFIEDYFISGGS